MTSPDERLAAFFAAEQPPARDPGFQAEVLAGLARRRFLEELSALSGFTAVGGAVLWLVWPALTATLEALGRGLAPGLIAVVVAGSVIALSSSQVLAPRS
jgi:hypothetical protein